MRHFPQSYEFSTLGGWIATRSGGIKLVAYDQDARIRVFVCLQLGECLLTHAEQDTLQPTTRTLMSSSRVYVS